MKHLRCRDLGFACDHEIRAESEAEVLQQAATHASKVHSVVVISERTTFSAVVRSWLYKL